MDKKRLWLTIDLALIVTSVYYALRCIQTHDERLPLALFCVVGTIVIYWKELRSDGRK